MKDVVSRPLFHWFMIQGLLFLGFESAQAIEVDSGVPRSQAQSLIRDQETLSKIQLQHNLVDDQTAGLLGISGRLSNQKLQEWLDQRVGTIISETMDLEHHLKAYPGQVLYPEADVFPEVVEARGQKPQAGKPGPGGKPAGSGKPVMVMANMGAGIYSLAKQNHVMLGLIDSEGQSHPLVSPRKAFIQIGAGLFDSRLRVNRETQDTQPNALSRLSTLFHEARHSDGHGATLAFPHAICPEGHDYAGFPACDVNLNGPYTIGARVLQSLAQGCGDCSTQDRTVLRMIVADSFSRVLKTFSTVPGKSRTATVWSDTPEQIRKFIPAKSRL